MAAGTEYPEWWIYRGTGQPPRHDADLPEPPPWRTFTGQAPADEDDETQTANREMPDADSYRRLGRYHQATTYQADDKEINLVNLALHLRRPLLVTGQPGVGKSTLAYSVAYELGLGPVLRWSITSRSTLLEGSYQYDAIGRLQEVSLQREVATSLRTDGDIAAPDIGMYLRLGPLGTALLPRRRPRALLIDEIDKSDIDLPNDLLNVFEDGEFVIPELARLKQERITVMTADNGTAELHHGLVRCQEFPFVILTSNSERAFPTAFLRRCVRLEIPPPDDKKLARMVAAHFKSASPEVTSQRQELIASFIRKQRDEAAVLASDQLLNALLMASAGLWDSTEGQALIEKHLLRSLHEA